MVSSQVTLQLMTPKKPEPQQPADPPAQDHQNDGNTGAQDNQGGTVKQGAQNNAPAPTAPAPVVETQTVSDGKAAVTGPKTVTHGQGIVVNGSGWSPYSVIAVKYDGGDIKLDHAVNYNGKDYASRGVVAIIQADADGKFTYTLPFPNSDKWGVGTVHDITFLSGSLKKGDEQHSVTLSVKIAGAGAMMPGRVTMDQDMALWHLFPPRAPESTLQPVRAALRSRLLLELLLNWKTIRSLTVCRHALKLPQRTVVTAVLTPRAHPRKLTRPRPHPVKTVPRAMQLPRQHSPTAIVPPISLALSLVASRAGCNNANNVLLSIAGLIILVLALTFRKRA